MKKTHFLLMIVGLALAGLVSCKNDTGSIERTPLQEQSQTRSAKRGVSYSFQIPADDAQLLGKAASWFYNWGPDINSSVNAATVANKIDFIPMVWNGAYDEARIRATKAAHPECNYILAFNEPNLTDQANMTPRQAAAYWPALKSLANSLNMKIISPAMNYGTLSGYSDPIVWLDEFFTLIPASDIDGIAIHCYMSNASSLAWYVGRFKKYHKPIWLTEFCAWESSIKSVSDQMKYMSDAINYLESDTCVVRYAWFIPRANGAVESYPYMQLLTKTQPYALSPLGKVFSGISTQDKTIWYPEFQYIPAENYSSLNMAETVKQGSFTNSVRLRPTTDESGDLEVFDFYTGYWLEYQLNVVYTDAHELEIRYAATEDTGFELLIDGSSAGNFTLSSTTSESKWKTQSFPISITPGKHTIRLKITKGGLIFNWLRLNDK